MKKIFVVSLILALAICFIPLNTFAVTVYVKEGLTGGTSADMDGIDGATLSLDDLCFVAEAGVFISYAAHLVAMAPSTNIGSAHPVTMGGQDSSQVMMDKVTNDAVAHIKGLAEKHGRNIEWAEKAVRESVNITEKEALEIYKRRETLRREIRALKNPSIQKLQKMERLENELNEQYYKLNLPCPFLDNNQCLIYEVRPLMCVAYYSIDPIELCSQLSMKMPKLKRAHLTHFLEDKIFYYPKLEFPFFLLMPLGVYRVISEGYSYLSTIRGITNIKNDAINVVTCMGTKDYQQNGGVICNFSFYISDYVIL